VSRLSTARVVAGIVVVIVFHIVAVFLVFGSGMTSFAAFVLPMILAYLGYYFLLRAGRPRIIPFWVGAFLLTLLSLCLSLPLPFNVYGS
jgi:hypothetical protein